MDIVFVFNWRGVCVFGGGGVDMQGFNKVVSISVGRISLGGPFFCSNPKYIHTDGCRR
jgi:hypothetical protein